MPAIDHDLFLADLAATGVRLTDARREAFEFLLARLSRDAGFTMLRALAYVLATVQWETAGTFLPIRERRFNRAKSPRAWEEPGPVLAHGLLRPWLRADRLGLQLREGGRPPGRHPVHGRRRAVRRHAHQLHRGSRSRAAPEVAYAICSRGMREGWFTGRKLGT